MGLMKGIRCLYVVHHAAGKCCHTFVLFFTFSIKIGCILVLFIWTTSWQDRRIIGSTETLTNEVRWNFLGSTKYGKSRLGSAECQRLTADYSSVMDFERQWQRWNHALHFEAQKLWRPSAREASDKDLTSSSLSEGITWLLAGVTRLSLYGPDSILVY